MHFSDLPSMSTATSQRRLPKTMLKLILASLLTSETSASIACTGFVVKSFAGCRFLIFQPLEKSLNFHDPMVQIDLKG